MKSILYFPDGEGQGRTVNRELRSAYSNHDLVHHFNNASNSNKQLDGDCDRPPPYQSQIMDPASTPPRSQWEGEPLAEQPQVPPTRGWLEQFLDQVSIPPLFECNPAAFTFTFPCRIRLTFPYVFLLLLMAVAVFYIWLTWGRTQAP
ncbi:hypothetical protein B7494_g1136 [Chlorociboria aeruginascens]|nr:hypothetical protein B7494_g1136 [Chlorociboria aeruginascens]